MIKAVHIVLAMLLLLAVFSFIASNDSELINTNKVVDCVDGGMNFISSQTCYKRVWCGDKIKLFNSKYCNKNYALDKENAQ